MVTKDIPLDLSEFDEPDRRRRKCLIGVFIEALEELDQRKVNAAMADKQYKTASIHRWLQRKPEGAGLKVNGVTRHRNGECSCLRT